MPSLLGAPARFLILLLLPLLLPGSLAAGGGINQHNYDGSTTTYDPKGRMYQVEYAIEATKRGSSTVVGVSGGGCAVVAVWQPRSPKSLAAPKPGKMVWKVDNHVGIAGAGLWSDFRHLCNLSQGWCSEHRFVYGTAIPCHMLARMIADKTHGNTHTAGKRPFAVDMLLAGWDDHNGPVLFHILPTGSVERFSCLAVGAESEAVNQHLAKEVVHLLPKAASSSASSSSSAWVARPPPPPAVTPTATPGAAGVAAGESIEDEAPSGSGEGEERLGGGGATKDRETERKERKEQVRLELLRHALEALGVAAEVAGDDGEEDDEGGEGGDEAKRTQEEKKEDEERTSGSTVSSSRSSSSSSNSSSSSSSSSRSSSGLQRWKKLRRRLRAQDVSCVLYEEDGTCHLFREGADMEGLFDRLVAEEERKEGGGGREERTGNQAGWMSQHVCNRDIGISTRMGRATVPFVKNKKWENQRAMVGGASGHRPDYCAVSNMAAQNRLRSTLSSPVRTQAFVGSLLPLPRARTSTRNSIKGAGRTRSWTGALAMSSFSDTAECPLLELEAPTENRASATFALDAAFRKRRGVLDVTCIYVGGKKEWPTYHDMGDQTEGVRVFYDPQETSYRELVDFFFTEHNCGTDSSYRGRQYMTGVWWHDEDQKKVLDAKVAELEASGKSVKTYQAEVTEAFRAEEYHQDFYRKNRRY